MSVVIKTFKTINGHYIYDRETNSIVATEKSDFEILERVEKGIETQDEIKVLDKYRKKGFFKESKLTKIQHPADSLLSYYLQSRVEQVTLQVTQNCNLRCAYCAYSGKYEQRTHTNRIMSFEVMKDSVDFAMKHSYGVDILHIGFYGGEPLLEIKKITKLIEYIRQKYPERKIQYTLTTNGTIFTDNIIRFLIESGINITVSLDGPKELHDANRVFASGEGSFDKIMENLQYIKKYYPDFFKKVSFNTVIAPENDYKCVNDFFDASIIIDDNRISKSTVSEYNIKDTVSYNDNYFITYGVQNLKILLSKIGFYDENKISKLFEGDFLHTIRFYKDLGSIFQLPEIAHPGGPCIPGSRRPMIDVDGNIFPCERVSEKSVNMCIGNIYRGFDEEKIRKILNVGKVTEKQCLNCWNFLHCGMCATAADNMYELSGEKRLSFCNSTKLSTLNRMRTICFLKENGYDFGEAIK